MFCKNMLAKIPTNKLNFTSYYHPRQELTSLVPNRRLNHYSYFFRDLRSGFIAQFLHDLSCDDSDNKNKFEVASLGCSYGQEVYSYAMKFAERGLKDKVKLTGYDLSQTVVDYAKNGEYDFKQYILDDFVILTRGKYKDYFKILPNKDVRIATELLPECDFQKTDIRTLKLPKESQDIILFNNVLYHITNNTTEKEQEEVCTSMAKLIYDAMKFDGLLVTDVEEDYPSAKYLDNALLGFGFADIGRGIYQKKTPDCIRENYISIQKSYIKNKQKLDELNKSISRFTI